MADASDARTCLSIIDLYPYLSLYIYLCLCLSIYLSIYVYIYICIYIYMNIFVYIYTYISSPIMADASDARTCWLVSLHISATQGMICLSTICARAKEEKRAQVRVKGALCD